MAIPYQHKMTKSEEARFRQLRLEISRCTRGLEEVEAMRQRYGGNGRDFDKVRDHTHRLLNEKSRELAGLTEELANRP